MSIFSDIGSAFSKPSAGVVPNKKGSSNPNSDINKILNSYDLLYKSDPTYWYTAKPYGFRSVSRDTKLGLTMFLPISPSNLTITTSFATNIIPTLYGTVEEHSAVRYYDIVIEGTTGMAPQFTTPGLSGTELTDSSSDTYAANKESGRAKFPIAGGTPLGGFLSSTLGAAVNILDHLGKIVDVLSTPKTNTGVYIDQTGYIAFHNLYRFLLKYKEDAAGVNSNVARSSKAAHPLVFFNYKDGNQYDVAIRSFTLKRSVENPMLYYYSIVMRGYNLNTAGNAKNTDDFTGRLKDLGLDGINPSSLLSKIKSISSDAKNILGSAKNGINLFGK